MKRTLSLVAALCFLAAPAYAQLVDTGLVVRYYFDEAASGAAPTAVEDASANNYDLTEINYGSGNLAYAEVGINRGLDSSSTAGVQRARRAIDNTSDAVRDALDGATSATIELVARIDECSSNGSRIFGITGRSGQNGAFMLRCGADENVVLALNDVVQGALGQGTSRVVVHLVFDSTQATAADRQRVSINGGTLTQISTGIALNEAITIGSDHDLIAFNRETGGPGFERSVDGAVSYAAIYTGAFTQGDINTNFAILTTDDDTPGGGGGDPAPVTVILQQQSAANDEFFDAPRRVANSR